MTPPPVRRDKRTPTAAEALKAKPTPADTSEIRVQRLRPRDVERRPELADRARPPALEPTAGGAALGGRLSQRLRLELRPPLETETNEPRRARQRDRRYRRLLALADVSATAAALAICIPLLGEGDMVTPLVVAGAPLIVSSARWSGSTTGMSCCSKNTLDELPALFQVATLLALLLVLGHTFRSTATSVQAGGRLLALARRGLPVAAHGARPLAKRLAPLEHCLLVGDPDACDLAAPRSRPAPPFTRGWLRSSTWNRPPSGRRRVRRWRCSPASTRSTAWSSRRPAATTASCST